MDTSTQFLLYKTSNNEIKVDVLIQGETLWLNQKQIGELFSVQRPAITKHIKNIYESGELEENSVSSIMEHTAKDNKTYKILVYEAYRESQIEEHRTINLLELEKDMKSLKGK